MSFGWNYSTVTQQIKNGIIFLCHRPLLSFLSRFFCLSFSLCIRNLVLYIDKETRKSDLPSNCCMIKIKKQTCRFWAGSKWKNTKTIFFFHIQNKNISKCYYLSVQQYKLHCNIPPKNHLIYETLYYRMAIAQENRHFFSCETDSCHCFFCIF